jgi:hypothetical protein
VAIVEPSGEMATLRISSSCALRLASRAPVVAFQNFTVWSQLAETRV